MMKLRSREATPLITCVIILALLIWLTYQNPPGKELVLPALLFLILEIYTSIFNAPLGGGMASLTPMVSVAAFLVIGLAPAGWVALLAALVNGILRYSFNGRFGFPKDIDPERATSLAAANATVKATSILAGGLMYQIAGGSLPLITIDPGFLLPLFLLALTYFVLHDLIFASFIAESEARAFQQSIRRVYSSRIRKSKAGKTSSLPGGFW